MAKERLNRLNLFEAVVFAIYGNWLLSFIVDKISFEKYFVSFNIFGIWYQEVCVGLAIACLLLLFVYSIFGPHAVTKRFLFIIYFGHVVGILGAYSVEEFEKSDIIFMILGLSLYVITFIIEMKRIAISRRIAIGDEKSGIKKVIKPSGKKEK